jgi:hypothetical protein
LHRATALLASSACVLDPCHAPLNE